MGGVLLRRRTAGFTQSEIVAAVEIALARDRTRQPPPRRDWVQVLTVAALILTALAGVAALYFTRLTIQQGQQGQITDRYNAAITNLGSSNIDVRLGGVYALQRMMKDSARDQPTIINVLCAFARSQFAPANNPVPLRATDVLAALQVVGTRPTQNHNRPTGCNLSGVYFAGMVLVGADLARSDLNYAHLAGVNLVQADLASIQAHGVDLSEAYLMVANFAGASLDGAHLKGANLSDANLNHAFLDDAHLNGADLVDTSLIDTDFAGANLTGADLRRAAIDTSTDFEDANLTGADLRGAEFVGANLRGANLRGADLRSADLRQAVITAPDLGGANLEGAYWPRSHRPPKSWVLDGRTGTLMRAVMPSTRQRQ